MRKTRTTALFFCPIILLLTTGPGVAQESAISARKLINAQGCKACHKLEGAGGNYAASLEMAAKRLSAYEIRLKLVNPGDHHSGGRTPDFSHLSEQEIDVLVDFLKQLHPPQKAD